MHTIKLRSLISALLFTSFAATSQGSMAAVGSTSVSVDFPEIIILHYRSSLGITFTGSLDSAIDEGAAGTITVPLGGATGDGTLSASGAATTTIPVTLQNMWAVRGITSSGNFQIASTIATDTASSGASVATMANLEVVGGGSSGGTISVPSAGIAPANAVYGGITFDLDISSVTQTGSHTGIEYTITASAP